MAGEILNFATMLPSPLLHQTPSPAGSQGLGSEACDIACHDIVTSAWAGAALVRSGKSRLFVTEQISLAVAYQSQGSVGKHVTYEGA